MATFEQNIRKIRGEAIRGSEVRESIADALEQSLHISYEEIVVPYPPAEGIHIQLAPTIVGSSDYIISFDKTS